LRQTFNGQGARRPLIDSASKAAVHSHRLNLTAKRDPERVKEVMGNVARELLDRGYSGSMEPGAAITVPWSKGRDEEHGRASKTWP
jgi:hypothetical protein